MAMEKNESHDTLTDLALGNGACSIDEINPDINYDNTDSHSSTFKLGAAGIVVNRVTSLVDEEANHLADLPVLHRQANIVVYNKHAEGETNETLEIAMKSDPENDIKGDTQQKDAVDGSTIDHQDNSIHVPTPSRYSFISSESFTTISSSCSQNHYGITSPAVLESKELALDPNQPSCFSNSVDGTASQVFQSLQKDAKAIQATDCDYGSMHALSSCGGDDFSSRSSDSSTTSSSNSSCGDDDSPASNLLQNAEDGSDGEPLSRLAPCAKLSKAIFSCRVVLSRFNVSLTCSSQVAERRGFSVASADSSVTSNSFGISANPAEKSEEKQSKRQSTEIGYYGGKGSLNKQGKVCDVKQEVAQQTKQEVNLQIKKEVKQQNKIEHDALQSNVQPNPQKQKHISVSLNQTAQSTSKVIEAGTLQQSAVLFCSQKPIDNLDKVLMLKQQAAPNQQSQQLKLANSSLTQGTAEVERSAPGDLLLLLANLRKCSVRLVDCVASLNKTSETKYPEKINEVSGLISYSGEARKMSGYPGCASKAKSGQDSHILASVNKTRSKDRFRQDALNKNANICSKRSFLDAQHSDATNDSTSGDALSLKVLEKDKLKTVAPVSPLKAIKTIKYPKLEENQNSLVDKSRKLPLVPSTGSKTGESNTVQTTATTAHSKKRKLSDSETSEHMEIDVCGEDDSNAVTRKSESERLGEVGCDSVKKNENSKKDLKTENCRLAASQSVIPGSGDKDVKAKTNKALSTKLNGTAHVETTGQLKPKDLDPWSQAIATFGMAKIPKKKKPLPEVPKESSAERLQKVKKALACNLKANPDRAAVTSQMDLSYNRKSYNSALDCADRPNDLSKSTSQPIANPYEDPVKVARRNQRRPVNAYASSGRLEDLRNRNIPSLFSHTAPSLSLNTPANTDVPHPVHQHSTDPLMLDCSEESSEFKNQSMQISQHSHIADSAKSNLQSALSDQLCDGIPQTNSIGLPGESQLKLEVNQLSAWKGPMHYSELKDSSFTSHFPVKGSSNLDGCNKVSKIPGMDRWQSNENGTNSISRQHYESQSDPLRVIPVVKDIYSIENHGKLSRTTGEPKKVEDRFQSKVSETVEMFASNAVVVTRNHCSSEALGKHTNERSERGAQHETDSVVKSKVSDGTYIVTPRSRPNSENVSVSGSQHSLQKANSKATDDMPKQHASSASTGLFDFKGTGEVVDDKDAAALIRERQKILEELAVLDLEENIIKNPGTKISVNQDMIDELKKLASLLPKSDMSLSTNVCNVRDEGDSYMLTSRRNEQRSSIEQTCLPLRPVSPLPPPKGATVSGVAAYTNPAGSRASSMLTYDDNDLALPLPKHKLSLSVIPQPNITASQQSAGRTALLDRNAVSGDGSVPHSLSSDPASPPPPPPSVPNSHSSSHMAEPPPVPLPPDDPPVETLPPPPPTPPFHPLQPPPLPPILTKLKVSELAVDCASGVGVGPYTGSPTSLSSARSGSSQKEVWEEWSTQNWTQPAEQVFDYDHHHHHPITDTQTGLITCTTAFSETYEGSHIATTNELQQQECYPAKEYSYYGDGSYQHYNVAQPYQRPGAY